MSNPSAIAAVTATLRNLVEEGIRRQEGGLPESVTTRGEISCTTLPLDQANEENGGRNRINLFLYQTQVNPAMRNMDVPNLKERGQPPLALDLFYLLTAYGEDHNRYVDHLLLGRAMSVMHDLPLLTSEELATTMAASGVHEQFEKVRITPQPMSVDELSKLWTTFQTQYRISAAYQVSVVLIDSSGVARAPLPVLKRGVEDRGVYVQTMPFPTLTGIRPVERRNQAVSPALATLGAQLGDTLELRGQSLGDGDASVRLRHPRLPEELEFAAERARSGADSLRMTLPNDARAHTTWLAGLYSVAAVIRVPGLAMPYVTNRVPLVVAPRLDMQPLLDDRYPPMRDNSGRITLKVRCVPHAHPEQQVALLVGHDRISAQSDPKRTDVLTFDVDKAPVGEFRLLRLRVDGIDSTPILPSASGLHFDVAQTVMFAPPPLILDVAIQPGAGGGATYAVTTSGLLAEDVDVSLLLQGKRYPAAERQSRTDRLSFEVTDPSADEHKIQLRVKNALSLPVTWSPAGLEFDPLHATLLALTPLISEIRPEEASPGDAVEVFCREGLQTNGTKLTVDGQEVAATRAGEKVLRFVAPKLGSGKYPIRVEDDGIEQKIWERAELTSVDGEREGLVLNPAHKLTIAGGNA